MRRMGLKFDPNKNETEVSAQPTKPVIQLYDVPESDKPSRRTLYPLTKEEEEYIAKAMTKYGTNYDKMFYDLKTNPMQHTREKLQKMGARYLLLEPNQRQVEVPENITHLLQSK